MASWGDPKALRERANKAEEKIQEDKKQAAIIVGSFTTDADIAEARKTNPKQADELAADKAAFDKSGLKKT